MPAAMKIPVATSDLGEKRPSPHNPCPEVQPPPSRVPKPTSRPPAMTTAQLPGMSGSGAARPAALISSGAAINPAMKATRLLLLTDVAGVLGKDKKPIPTLTVDGARALIADGTISGGMIPKIETCLEAIAGGVEAAVIIDGRVPRAILLELFAEGAGTLIRR